MSNWRVHFPLEALTPVRAARSGDRKAWIELASEISHLGKFPSGSHREFTLDRLSPLDQASHDVIQFRDVGAPNRHGKACGAGTRLLRGSRHAGPQVNPTDA
jgi:hypothetical protein